MPVKKVAKKKVARKTAKLVDVDKKGKTKKQLRAARKTAWEVKTAAQEKTHKDRIVEDVLDDLEEGLPLAGHRGGRRVRLSWANTRAWDAWQKKFEGIPKIGNRFTIEINGAAYEKPGDEDKKIAPSGKRFTEIQCTEEEIEWLEINKVTVTQAGSFDPIVEETP